MKIKTLSKRLGLFLLLVTIALSGQSCTKGGSPAAQQAYKSITLEYWTVFNSPDDYTQVIADYEAIHPNIRINVKKFLYDEYETQLLNALAEDRGPDIFSVHNTSLPAYRPKLLPLPSQTTLAYQTTTGTISKETVTELHATRSLNEADLQRDFLQQVYNDVFIPELTIQDNKPVLGDKVIYALPISFDTMVMYYNRDLLDNAGIAQPAKTWNEFQDNVQKLARFDSQGNILSAGAAIGTADNVPRSTDILSLLMMQNGAQMIDENSRTVNFHRIPDSLRGQRDTVPGQEALQFYTSFANPNNRNYTWNADQSDGFEAFLQGKTAYYFGYAYDLPNIRGLAPKLNFGIANMPQIQGNPQIFFANYWVEAVSRKTQNPDAAWDFLQFITNSQEAKKFTDKAKKPTARRDLINDQLNDTDLYVFASQLLQSQSWYNGQDAAAEEAIMKDLITQTLQGTQKLSDLLKLAAERVQQTLRIQ